MRRCIAYSALSLFVLMFVSAAISPGALAAAEDFYKPYLHEPQVPEHPKVSLYGSYNTNIFPGSATYTYPIQVPAGTNGVQPSLSITYNSQSAKQRPDVLGAGWSLTQDYVYRDVNSTPASTSDDQFNLLFGGASYKLVYDSADGFYHTKTESYMRVQNLTGGNNTYGMYWLVTSKDGTKFRFGYSIDSELASNTGRPYALRWSLDYANDTHGNGVYYSYLEDPSLEDNGTVYISNISYNNDRQRLVQFSYEAAARPDMRITYDQGNLLKESRRLTGVSVSANGNLARSYAFEYSDLDPEKSLSALSRIKLYGSDGVSLLDQLSFDYYTSAPGFEKDGSWTPPVAFSNNDNDLGVRDVDLNNDGVIDLIQSRGYTAEAKAWLSDKTGNWTDSSATWALPVNISKSKTTYQLVYECRGGYCSQCHGSCPYDKCYIWGCSCGDGMLYTKNEEMCYGKNYDGYNAVTLEVDNGVRFADINNDGFVDILQGVDGTRQAWLNNGSGWVNASNTWAPPVSFVSSDIDTGTILTDFNGDGRIDIIQSNNNGGEIASAYVNNGTGWVNVSSSWKSPVYFTASNKDIGTRVEDINDDGLPDIVQASSAYSSEKQVFLNNGTGWTNYSSSWDVPVYFITATEHDNGVRFADVNGDGLLDILQSSDSANNTWINNGTGWTQNNSWGAPEYFTRDEKNIGRRLADVNGDGLVDIVVAQTNSTGSSYWTWRKSGATPYMLKTITNELGGTTAVAYQNSTKFDNTGGDGLSDLGFNVWVVRNVTSNNSMAGAFGIASNYSYNYSGGRYDYADFEFRGFAQTDERRPDSSVAKHYFHQDTARKGIEYRTGVTDSSGSLYSKAENLYTYTNQSGYFKVALASQASYAYDGSPSNPIITNVTHSYDIYGNVVENAYLGNVNTSGDEKYERYTYAYNASAWIVGKPSLYRLFGADNATKLAETMYAYDNLAQGASPAKGDLTQVEQWLDGGTNPITRFVYDGYGNVIEKIDPRGNSEFYRYGLRDATHTYADRTTNALYHTTDYMYDLGTGNLMWEMKNGINASYYYDTFGRITREVQPYDSYELPTKSYVYSFDGTAPESVTVSERTSANSTFDTYYFYDGLANLVQLKAPADGGQQVVKNIFYDGLGRVHAEQNPYFGVFSAALSTPSASVNNTTYGYDAMSRVIRLDNPDGTNKTIVFNRTLITAYDENGHRKAYALDAYGRIANVLEYNNNPTLGTNYESEMYNTTYGYDSADNFINITDSVGHIFSFSHDTLGRRTGLSDPDTGTWAYSYDAADNLVSQRQVGGGNLVSGDGYYREYDSLNQLIRIRNGSVATSPLIENYTYDPFGQRVKIMRNDSAGTVVLTPYKQVLQIVNATGTYNYLYVYQDGVLLARMNPDGGKWYYHPDQLGSTTLITDQNGNVVEQTFYGPFGETLSGGTAEAKLYTGQYADAADRYYFGARYYNPNIKRFIQHDSLFQNIYNPQGLNGYSYVLNNPYKYVDPTGRFWNQVIYIAYEYAIIPLVEALSEPSYMFITAQSGYECQTQNSCTNLAVSVAAPGASKIVSEGAGYTLNRINSGSNVASTAQNIANELGSTDNAVGGTRRHSAAEQMIRDYNLPNVYPEVSIKDRTIVNWGTRGSIRIDLLQSSQDLSRAGVRVDTSQIGSVFDYKFGYSGTAISPQQASRIFIETGQQPIVITPQTSQQTSSILNEIGNWWNNLFG